MSLVLLALVWVLAIWGAFAVSVGIVLVFCGFRAYHKRGVCNDV